MPRQWTAQEWQQARDLQAGGLTYLEISARFGVSRNAIAGLLNRPCPPPTRMWTAAEDEFLRQRWTAGGQCKEIALELGRSAHSISPRREKIGLPPRWSYRLAPQTESPITLVALGALICDPDGKNGGGFLVTRARTQ